MDSTMANEPVSASNALFGPDGTQLPDPLPVFLDPLTGPEPGTPDLPPVLPVPDASAMGAAIAAAFGAGPAGPGAAAASPHPPATFPHRQPAPPVVWQPLPRGPAGSVPHRPPLSAPSRTFRPIPPADLRRGHDRRRPGSSVGTRAGCVIALIVFGVVAFSIIAGIIDWVSAFFG